MLDRTSIQNQLTAAYDIRLFDEVTSTNTLLKNMALEGASDGLVLIADSQTGGKGRLGRSFFSPSGTGLYISVLLRPADMELQNALSFTTIAAVAACRAIEEVGLSRDEVKIKWVNDIYVHDRKCVGILTESSVDAKTGKLAFAVMGIGFNVYEPEGGFPEEIREIAGALFPSGSKQNDDLRNQLAASFLNHFYAEVSRAETKEYVNEYRARSMVIGKPIYVLSPATGERTAATVLDITDDCALVVQYEDGKVQELSTGEVSIRFR